MAPAHSATGREGILPFGRTSSGTVVGPSLDAHQGRHLAVLGETGMGKSSLLVALARRVSLTYGLVLLDPLGSTADALEQELGAAARTRLLRIAPIGSPLSINALEGIQCGEHGDPVRSERRLNDLVHALRRVRSGRYTDSAYWGPRLEEMLTRAVRAAAAWPEGTLADAHTLLATGARMHREVPSQALGPVRELSDRIRERPEDAEGARRLLYELVRSPVLERMLCARTPDLRTSELVRPGRIVIVSGDAGQVGESAARYLLSVYLALVWSEILSRPSRAKLFVLLDEAQWFSHESLTEMLRLGRSANLHVVLATQAVSSLPETIAEAVWTNVADFVAFRGSPEEAREFARAARGVSTEAILSLPRGQAAVLLGKGQSVQWLKTLRLPESLPPRTAADSNGAPNTTPDPRSLDSSSTASSISDRWTTDRVPKSAAPASPTVTGDAVVELLRQRARATEPGTHLQVALDELRRTVDPSGLAIRRAGSILGKAGAILSTERTTTGTVWTLDPSRIPGPRDPSDVNGPTGGS